jgi:SM-20-related protein
LPARGGTAYHRRHCFERSVVINPDLDIDYWRCLLAERRRAQVTQILDPVSATRLHEHLRSEVPWTLAYRESEDPRVLANAQYMGQEPAQRKAFLERIALDARERYGFAYDSYMMVDAYMEQRDPGLLLNVVIEFLNSPDFLAFARILTGLREIRRVTAQATQYLPGHFLKRHNDLDGDRDRLVAYVFNLTRDWQADWGGLLEFYAADGGVIETFVPRYNALSLFYVPQMHAVSLVAPWAMTPRLSITGWFMR